MKTLIHGLVVLAVLAFLVGTLGRFATGGSILGQEPYVFWRGSMGLLAFAITLILMQIRDKK